LLVEGVEKGHIKHPMPLALQDRAAVLTGKGDSFNPEGRKVPVVNMGPKADIG